MNPGATTSPFASIVAFPVSRRLRYGNNLASPNAHAAHAVQARFRIHHPAIRDDQIVALVLGTGAPATRFRRHKQQNQTQRYRASNIAERKPFRRHSRVPPEIQPAPSLVSVSQKGNPRSAWGEALRGWGVTA